MINRDPYKESLSYYKKVNGLGLAQCVLRQMLRVYGKCYRYGIPYI